MKHLILKTVIIFALVAVSNAGYSQNNFELRWGNTILLNSPVDKAFGRNPVFSLGFFHPLENSRFEIGLKWNHEHYYQKDDFFSNDYDGNFKLHYLSVAGRYFLIKKSSFDVFTEIEAGFHHLNIKETKSGSTSDKRKNGFSTGISTGAEVKITDRILIGAGLQCHIHFTDKLNFNDQFSVKYINDLGGTLGLKFLLKKKNSE